MIIPLSTDRPSHRSAVVTPALVGLNVAIFLLGALLEQTQPALFQRLYEPLVLARGGVEAGWRGGVADAGTLADIAGRWWTFFTYAFLHAGVLHIVFNMVFLWVFGPPVEDRFGRVGFLAFYLVGAAASGALHIAFEPTGVVGASGAIAAVTGAFLIMFPRTRVRCFFLLGGGMGWMSATWLIGFAIVFDLVARGVGYGGGVARLAHLGGYAFGAAVAFTLLATRVLSSESYDVFTMVRQARRRRELREAMAAAERERGVVGGGGAGEVAIRPQKSRAGWASAGGRGSASSDGGEQVHPEQEALALARAEVSRLAASGDLGGATKAYGAMLERFAPARPVSSSDAGTMSRRVQLEIGNHAFATGEHALAATAYERFAMAYPEDRETPKLLVLTALICGRHLGDKARGRAALERITARLEDPAEDALALQLAGELAEGAAKPQAARP